MYVPSTLGASGIYSQGALGSGVVNREEEHRGEGGSG